MYKQLMSSTVYGNEDYSFDVMEKYIMLLFMLLQTLFWSTTKNKMNEDLTFFCHSSTRCWSEKATAERSFQRRHLKKPFFYSN